MTYSDYPFDDDDEPTVTTQDPGEHEVINVGRAMALTPGGKPQELDGSDLSTGIHAARGSTVTSDVDGVPIAVSETREDVAVLDALVMGSLPRGPVRTHAFRMRARMNELDAAHLDRVYGPNRIPETSFGALPLYEGEPEDGTP